MINTFSLNTLSGAGRRPTRREAIAAGLAALALGSAPARAEGRVLRVGHFPNVTHGQALVARYLERTGRPWFGPRLGNDVTIEWYTYNAGPSAMEAIFTNALDITYVGPNPALNAYARSRGEEIRVVAGAVRGGAALVVQPGLALERPADFKGRRIGTPQFGNTQDVAARAWLTAGGLRVTQTGGDVQVVPTANPDQLMLFRRGELDAVWTVEPWVSRLTVEAGGRVLVEEADAITTILTASVRALHEKADLVWSFVAAHRELTAWIIANAAEAQEMVREELRATFRAEISADIIAQAWRRMTLSADISLKDFEAFVAAAQAAGFLRGIPDLGRFVETRS